MVIETSKNRTNRYLKNTLNGYGKTFLTEMSQLSVYAGYPLGSTINNMYVMDSLYYRAKGWDNIKPYLFIVFDTLGCYNQAQDKYTNVRIGKEKFLEFLKYIRKQRMYEGDYWVNKNQHCVVLKCDYLQAYSAFWKSKYSEMYSAEDLKKLGFSKKVIVNNKTYSNLTYAVLAKDEQALQNLQHEVYKHYGTTDVADDPTEYDIPWFIQDEVLNYQYLSDIETSIVKEWKNISKSTLCSSE